MVYFSRLRQSTAGGAGASLGNVPISVLLDGFVLVTDTGVASNTELSAPKQFHSR
jgi:hypothetical protein